MDKNKKNSSVKTEFITCEWMSYFLPIFDHTRELHTSHLLSHEHLGRFYQTENTIQIDFYEVGKSSDFPKSNSRRHLHSSSDTNASCVLLFLFSDWSAESDILISSIYKDKLTSGLRLQLAVCIIMGLPGRHLIS